MNAPLDWRSGATLLIGGARSGKSSLAVRMGRRWVGPVRFVATAVAGDEEIAARVAAHQAERPAGWATVEAPLELAAALDAAADEELVIIDCLTFWTANLVFSGLDDRAVEARAADLGRRLSARVPPTVVVTNETGMGVIPPSELGRRYRDLLGRVNARVAAASTRSLLLVAGRALPLGDPGLLLGLGEP